MTNGSNFRRPTKAIARTACDTRRRDFLLPVLQRTASEVGPDIVTYEGVVRCSPGGLVRWLRLYQGSIDQVPTLHQARAKTGVFAFLALVFVGTLAAHSSTSPVFTAADTSPLRPSLFVGSSAPLSSLLPAKVTLLAVLIGLTDLVVCDVPDEVQRGVEGDAHIDIRDILIGHSQIKVDATRIG